jgi:hypothetical protein
MQPSASWRLGWVAGVAVVAIAAGLLLTIIALARRIVRQAGEIEQAIDGAREHTAPLFELARTNLALDQVVADLRRGRREAA